MSAQLSWPHSFAVGPHLVNNALVRGHQDYLHLGRHPELHSRESQPAVMLITVRWMQQPNQVPLSIPVSRLCPPGLGPKLAMGVWRNHHCH